MNHDFFVAAAFIVTAFGTLALVTHGFWAMRKAEALADNLKNPQ